MLVALIIFAALVYLREKPSIDNKKEPSKPIQNQTIPPPMGFDVKAKNMYSPLTTPPAGTHMKNPKMDPVPSIYNTVLNVDERGTYDEDFFKKRQIYTNWDDMEEHFALDNFYKKDVPMTGGVLVNGLHKKEIVDPVGQYGMFTHKIDNKYSEAPWM